MNYIDEHLLPGQVGHFLLVLSLVASLVASIAYFKSANALIPEEANSWRKIARISFIVDAISVFTIFAIIYFIISHHFFD